MQRPLLLVIAVVIALVVAGYLCFTQFGTVAPGSSPDDAAPVTPSAPDPETGGVAAADPAGEAVQRTPVEAPAGGESVVTGSHVLRVILEGIPEENAAETTVTLSAVDTRTGSTAEIKPTWPCRGPLTEFDLDPFFAEVVERHVGMRVDELGVVIEHPMYLRETNWFPLSSGEEHTNGRIVHEVRERLVRPVFWPELTLAVRDAETRVHLHDVELSCVPTHYMNLRQQPGVANAYTSIAEGLSSPIALLGGHGPDDQDHVAGVALRPAVGEVPQLVELAGRVAPERGVLVYARAPGYAWGRIVLDFSSAGERELLLGPAATLSVRLRNVQLERYRALEGEATLCITRLWPNGDVGYVRFQQLDETLAAVGLLLEGMEPGEYAVAVQLGGEWSSKQQRVLVREELSLAAFESRELVLTVADPPAPPTLATLGGVVSFPAFGSEENVRFQLFEVATYRRGAAEVDLALSDMERIGGALPTWSFRAEDLPVGRYQAHLLPFLTNWMIDIPVGGREGVEFVVPKLAEVLVETVDAETGERIPLEVLRYYYLEKLPGQVHDAWKKADVDEPGRFRFWTAPGAAKVGTLHIPSGLGYGIRQYQDLELVSGLQSARLQLIRLCSIRFEIRVDGAALLHEDDAWAGVSQGIRAVGHAGEVIQNRLPIVEVSAPGVYEVSFEGTGFGRFHAILPRRVDVRPGEPAEVIVELRRK